MTSRAMVGGEMESLMAEDLLTKLDAAARLGMAICSDAAREIHALRAQIAAFEADDAKARADGLTIAVEKQRQAAARAKDHLGTALASQRWFEDAHDPEEALRDALAVVTVIADAAEPSKDGARLLEAARSAPELRREINDLRVSMAASAGINADAFLRQGIAAEVSIDHGHRVMTKWDGEVISVSDGATVTLTLHGVGPGAQTLAEIGTAMRRR